MNQQVLEIARKFISEKFPDCLGSILAGSFVRNEATSTSDLDIVILDESIQSAYRETFLYKSTPIEVFIHNEKTIREFFKSDIDRARPSLPKMISEGVILVDCLALREAKAEAKRLLESGPSAWSTNQIDSARYFITDLLDDFIGSSNQNEIIFIVGKLAERLHEFYLRTNKQWIGESKWLYRAMRNVDAAFADEFAEVFDQFYRTREKDRVIELTDRILNPFGGRLTAGFSIGKSEG